MDLTMYKPTEHEQWIDTIYRKHRILYAHEMDIDLIAEIFNSMVVTHKNDSKVIYDGDFAMICLCAYLSQEKKREQFFHELGHFVRHDGNQNLLPKGLVQLQENEANAFQLYAAIPTYMLEEFNDIQSRSAYIKFVAEEFKYTPAFVQRRVEQIERRILQAEIDSEIRAVTTPVRSFFDYTPETYRILDQLHRQVSKKKGTMNHGKNRSVLRPV